MLSDWAFDPLDLANQDDPTALHYTAGGTDPKRERVRLSFSLSSHAWSTNLPPMPRARSHACSLEGYLAV
jgi:hypothetical protein